jgi:hypothetical protein
MLCWSRWAISCSRRLVRSSSSSYPRRSVASNTLVQISWGRPSSSRRSAELIRAGSREPSAHTISTAIARMPPCMCKSGEQCVS